MSNQKDCHAATSDITRPEKESISPIGSDPWIHRRAGMLCQTCMFYVEKKKSTGGVRTIIGRCRKNAPTMKGFPVVFPSDWCGEHRLDENKM